MAIMIALSLTELATTFPVSAASYYFLKRSLGPSAAFLSLWIKVFSHCLGLGTQTLLIASYLIQPFYPGCPAPELPIKCLALATLWSFGFLNARRMKAVAWLQSISTVIKMSVLCLISLTGIVLLVIGKKENVSRFENALDAALPSASQVVEAIIQECFAYRGSLILANIAGTSIYIFKMAVCINIFPDIMVKNKSDCYFFLKIIHMFHCVRSLLNQHLQLVK
jgi:L-type amino acid transporter 13